MGKLVTVFPNLAVLMQSVIMNIKPSNTECLQIIYYAGQSSHHDVATGYITHCRIPAITFVEALYGSKVINTMFIV